MSNLTNHVCGLQGFGSGLGDSCPACTPTNPAPESAGGEEPDCAYCFHPYGAHYGWNTVRRAACDARDAILAAAKETK